MPNTQYPNREPSEKEDPSIKASGGDQPRQSGGYGNEQKSGQQGGQQGGKEFSRQQQEDDEKNRQNAPGNKPQGR